MKDSNTMLRETEPIPEILSLWNGVILNAISESGAGDIFNGPTSGAAIRVMTAIREMAHQKLKSATKDNPLYIFGGTGILLCKTWTATNGDDYSVVNEYQVDIGYRDFENDGIWDESIPSIWDGLPYTLRVMKTGCSK